MKMAAKLQLMEHGILYYGWIELFFCGVWCGGCWFCWDLLRWVLGFVGWDVLKILSIKYIWNLPSLIRLLYLSYLLKYCFLFFLFWKYWLNSKRLIVLMRIWYCIGKSGWSLFLWFAWRLCAFFCLTLFMAGLWLSIIMCVTYCLFMDLLFWRIRGGRPCLVRCRRGFKWYRGCFKVLQV